MNSDDFKHELHNMESEQWRDRFAEISTTILLTDYFQQNSEFLLFSTDVCDTDEKKMFLIDFCINFEVPMDTLPDSFYVYKSIVKFIIRAKTTKLNLKTSDFIDKLENKNLTKPQLLMLFLLSKKEAITGKIKEKLDFEIDKFVKKIDELKKNCYIPLVKDSDSTDPRISKFGGKLPHLSNDNNHLCSKCGNHMSLVFSLYIETIPDEIKNYFPKSKHDSILTCIVCNKCYDPFKIIMYENDNFNKLVYEEINDDIVFNENRIVWKWDKQEMEPFIDSFSDYDFEERVIINKILMEYERTQQTYLGGFPKFKNPEKTQNHVLLIEMEESLAATNFWGENGIAQVWMTPNDSFGSFVFEYSLD